MPHATTVAAALRAYRYAQAGLLRDPANPLRHRRLEDAAYTLCVLMDERDTADAVAQAERLLAASPATRAEDGTGRARTVIPS